MMNEKIDIRGYTVLVQQDECAENPLEEDSTEPPLWVFDGDRVTGYNNPPGIPELVKLIPDHLFGRGNRGALLKALPMTLRVLARDLRDNNESLKDLYARVLEEQWPEPDRSWTEAETHFECLARLCDLAGVHYAVQESVGYSQGDIRLLMAIATPDWETIVGAPKETHVQQCEDACNLYGSWVWGDVYGITKITDPRGKEILDSTLRTFYGTDHEASGLLEAAGDIIEGYEWFCEQEAREALFWAARDVLTTV
jgi:hypothetical protein